jgi:hypothetical protein
MKKIASMPLWDKKNGDMINVDKNNGDSIIKTTLFMPTFLYTNILTRVGTKKPLV